MTVQTATLADLLADLASVDPRSTAVFQVNGQDIGVGYHVTELKLAHIDSIDCGGRRSRWTESQMQLLDGQDGSWITAGKLASILERSAKAVDGLATAPLSVEFAPRNRGLSRFHLGEMRTDGPTRVTLPLVAEGALCKPARDTECCPPETACR